MKLSGIEMSSIHGRPVAGMAGITQEAFDPYVANIFKGLKY